MNSDKIYIVVPVYKVEAYLERCVDSILNQTYQNYELILVDDGSPDNCPAICNRYAAEHENITVIHQENGGLSAARNTGIDYSLKQGAPETSWITFIDSDDMIHPCYLEYLLQGACKANVDVSVCSYIRTSSPEAESLERKPFAYTAMSPEDFWRKDRTNATVAWGKLYRTNCFQEIRYPVGRIHEDEFTTYQILFRFSQLSIISIPLYFYFSNSTGITQAQWSPRRLDELDALSEQTAYFKENNFPIAYSLSARDLLQHSIKYLMYIHHLSPKYNNYTKEVKVWRNRAFFMYAKAVGYKRAIQYWYQVRIKTPIHRVLKNESVFAFLRRRIIKKLRF